MRTHEYIYIYVNTYNLFLTNNITSSYKNTTIATLNNINHECQKITSHLDIQDRTEPFNPKYPHFNLKDHTLDFERNPRLDYYIHPNPI